ncbi:Mo-dependent nitrogenase C-terminal domain-containing protein [Mastigocladopsis repens]
MLSTEIHNSKTARQIANLIPQVCPFTRKTKLFNHTPSQLSNVI